MWRVKSWIAKDITTRRCFFGTALCTILRWFSGIFQVIFKLWKRYLRLHRYLSSLSYFRHVGSHLTKTSGTWSLKSLVTTEFTRLAHRCILIGTLFTFSVPQPRGLYLRRLDSGSNSSPRSRAYQEYIRLYAPYSLCLRVLEKETLSRKWWETFDWYGGEW